MTPSPNCPVCASELTVPVEICTRCHTPHHADCWRFTGYCALYACGSKRCRVAKNPEREQPAAERARPDHRGRMESAPRAIRQQVRAVSAPAD